MKLKKEQLKEEIKNLLKDEFVAEVNEQENVLSLRFLNGQKFIVTIEEE